MREHAGYGHSGELVVSGHSQGGNIAEYATMMSKYAPLIDQCISFDAPNHSSQLKEHILTSFGEEHYEKMRNKIFSINGDNDYVNEQGNESFATAEYYIATDNAWAHENGRGGLAGWHDFLYFFDRETGELLPHDAEQGPIGRLMARVAKRINELPSEQQEDCAMAMMCIIEILLGSKDIEDLKRIGFGAEELIGMIAVGLPILLEELLNDQEAMDAIISGSIPPEIKLQIVKFLDEAPPWLAIVAVGMGSLIAISISSKGLELASNAIVIAKLLDFVITEVQNIKHFTEEVKNTIVDICNTVKDSLGEIVKFIHSMTPGVRYANSNPYFKVNTLKLNDYATRVNKVNSRLKRLDKDLGSLYWKVGLLDLLDVLKANLLTSESPTLIQIRVYLENSAKRFESAENKALTKMEG